MNEFSAMPIDDIVARLERIEAEIERLHALSELRQQTIIERLRVIALALSIREG